MRKQEIYFFFFNTPDSCCKGRKKRQIRKMRRQQNKVSNNVTPRYYWIQPRLIRAAKFLPWCFQQVPKSDVRIQPEKH